MTQNVGGFDRILRIVAGVGLLLFAIMGQSEYAVWGWLGIIPLATGVIRWCPAYLPFGIRTGSKPQSPGDANPV